MTEQTKSGSLLDARPLHILVLLLLAIAFFWPVVVDPEALIHPSYSSFSDLTVTHWPNAHFLSSSYDTFRQIPLWKDTILSGMPAIANPLAMMYYPPNFLFLRFPIDAVFNLLTLAHIFISGLGMYLFLRVALGRSGPASLVAAALYMFSGRLIAHVAAGHVSMIAAMAWVPLILLGTNRTIVKRSPIASILTSIMLALQAVTHTQILIYTIYFVVPYAAFELWGEIRQDGNAFDLPRLKRILPVLLPIPFLTAALAAVQLAPLIEMAPYSDRALTLQQAAEYALTVPQVLLGLFLPNASVGHQTTIYPGLVVFGLAVSALFGPKKDRHLWFFLGAATVGTVLSLGSSGLLFDVFYWVAPGWRWMRAAARLWLFVNLALVVMASYGLDSLMSGAGGDRPARWRSLAVSAVVLICALTGAALMVGFGAITRATVALIAVPVALLALGWWRRSQHPAPVAIAAVVLVLGLLDSGSFARSLLAFEQPAAVFDERADVAARLAAEQSGRPFRIYSPSYSIPQQVAASFELQLADGVDAVHLERYDRFMAAAGGYGESGYSVSIPPFPADGAIRTAYRDTVPDVRLLGLLNVRYFVSDFPVEVDGLTSDGTAGETYVYRNEHELPRAFAVPGLQVATDGEGAWAVLDGLDLTQTAVIETPESHFADLAAKNEGKSLVEADVVFWSPNKIVTEVDLAEPALLVLSEMWYPGWVAYDNGSIAPILRTDYLLRGVWLGPGHHSVAWLYRPDSLEWGLRITGISALLSALVLVVVARRNASQAISARRR